jgi:hypothetical protein
MRKFAVGLNALVVASAITCDAANAGRQGFVHPPVFFHRPFFFHQPFFGNRTFFSFSFPVIFPPVFAPYYPAYYPSYDYGGGYAPTTSIQQAPGPAAAQYSYYCNSPKGYYPYVQSCPAGWYPVPTTPPRHRHLTLPRHSSIARITFDADFGSTQLFGECRSASRCPTGASGAG